MTFYIHVYRNYSLGIRSLLFLMKKFPANQKFTPTGGI